jgi:hypothetical protein
LLSGEKETERTDSVCPDPESQTWIIPEAAPVSAVHLPSGETARE